MDKTTEHATRLSLSLSATTVDLSVSYSLLSLHQLFYTLTGKTEDQPLLLPLSTSLSPSPSLYISLSFSLSLHCCNEHPHTPPLLLSLSLSSLIPVE